MLMTQAPHWLFGYWEITAESLAAKEAEQQSGEEYGEVLRLTWPQRSLFDRNFVFVPVSLAARRAYCRVPFPGIIYRAELGWLSSKGTFIALLDSNECESPEGREESEVSGSFTAVKSGIV